MQFGPGQPLRALAGRPQALAGRPGNWQRRARFRPFRLVGGDKAGREPWRSAAALMWAEDWDVGAASAANHSQRTTKPYAANWFLS